MPKIKRVLMRGGGVETQVYPAQWHWRVNSSTLAYYPLSPTTTVNDFSGNNKTLTIQWTMLFWNYQWIDCASFQNSWAWLQNTTVKPTTPQVCTISFWAFCNTTSDHFNIFFSIWYDRNNMYSWWRNYYNSRVCIWELAWWAESIISWFTFHNARHLVTFVWEWSTAKLYVDWTYVTAYTPSIWDVTWLYIWVNPNTTSERMTWYMSQFILEDRSWTATMVKDYYDSTKKNYQ